jgi:transposase, IS30 family
MVWPRLAWVSCYTTGWGSQGKEMAEHVPFRIDTGIQAHVCDSRSLSQRPASKNANGLLRRNLPKGTDLEQFTQRQLDAIARGLNGWRQPTLS